MGHTRAWFPTAASGKKASNSFRKQQVHHIKAIFGAISQNQWFSSGW